MLNPNPFVVHRLLWKFSGALLAILVPLGTFTIWLTLRTANLYFLEVQQSMDREVAPHIASEVATFSQGRINRPALEKLFHDRMILNPMLEIYLLDPNGEILAYSAPPEKILSHHVSLQPILRFVQPGATVPILGDDPRNPARRHVFSAAPVRADGRLLGYVYAILGGEEYESATKLLGNSAILRTGAWLVGVSITVTALAGLLAFRALARRLGRLRAVMESFQGGALSARAEPGARDEIGAVAEAFNRMAERIVEQMRTLEKTDRARRELMANISHDLRTPASSIHGYLQRLLAKEADLKREERVRYLQIALGGAERLNHLVHELFELAKLDAPDVVVHPEPFSIADLAQDVVQKLQILAERTGVALSVEQPASLPLVLGDIGLIERALENLLDNAMHATPSGGSVQVVLTNTVLGVEVRVKDNGCGIPREELPFVFDRFRRVGESRGGAGGAGLGLAITKRIVDLHSSSLRVDSEAGLGTAFTFHLQMPASVPRHPRIPVTR